MKYPGITFVYFWYLYILLMVNLQLRFLFRIKTFTVFNYEATC